MTNYHALPLQTSEDSHISSLKNRYSMGYSPFCHMQYVGKGDLET